MILKAELQAKEVEVEQLVCWTAAYSGLAAIGVE
jgi:hypothetical protein